MLSKVGCTHQSYLTLHALHWTHPFTLHAPFAHVKLYLTSTLHCSHLISPHTSHFQLHTYLTPHTLNCTHTFTAYTLKHYLTQLHLDLSIITGFLPPHTLHSQWHTYPSCLTLSTAAHLPHTAACSPLLHTYLTLPHALNCCTLTSPHASHSQLQLHTSNITPSHTSHSTNCTHPLYTLNRPWGVNLRKRVVS
jgi:hypothetical protein